MKPDCGTAALNLGCSSKATGRRQDEYPNVKCPDVDCKLTSTSKALRPTGSQEISPVLTTLFRAKADALTGIKRADTANEKTMTNDPRFGTSCQRHIASFKTHDSPMRDEESILLRSRNYNCDPRAIPEVPLDQ